MFLNNAQVCLDCEKLFIGDQCPKCCSRHFFYLRKYYPPMLRFGGENGFVKEKHIPLQEELFSLEGTPNCNINCPLDHSVIGELEGSIPREVHITSVGYECGKQAGDRPQVGESSYQRGKLLEAICTLLKGSYWVNAGTSSHLESQVDKESAIKPRAESIRRYEHSKNVHERELNFE